MSSRITISAEHFKVAFVAFTDTGGYINITHADREFPIGLQPRRFAATADKITRLILAEPGLSYEDATVKIGSLLKI